MYGVTNPQFCGAQAEFAVAMAGMEQVLVCEVGDGNDVYPGVYGHLYGVGPDVPGSSDDHYGLAPSGLTIL